MAAPDAGGAGRPAARAGPGDRRRCLFRRRQPRAAGRPAVGRPTAVRPTAERHRGRRAGGRGRRCRDARCAGARGRIGPGLRPGRPTRFGGSGWSTTTPRRSRTACQALLEGADRHPEAACWCPRPSPGAIPDGWWGSGNRGRPDPRGGAPRIGERDQGQHRRPTGPCTRPTRRASSCGPTPGPRSAGWTPELRPVGSGACRPVPAGVGRAAGEVWFLPAAVLAIAGPARWACAGRRPGRPAPPGGPADGQLLLKGSPRPADPGPAVAVAARLAVHLRPGPCALLLTREPEEATASCAARGDVLGPCGAGCARGRRGPPSTRRW